MATLSLYSIFHINLAFSSIPKSHYSLILDRCYWPLLDIASRMNIPLGLETSGYSLEQLEKTDASFVTALKTAWQQNQIEFIGSGYTQNILPLCPARVNQENLRIGHEIYTNLLGQKPVTAYVNEQTYSSGLVDLYLDTGYQQIVMEYNNAARFNHYSPDTRYKPQKAFNPDASKSITIIWNDSTAFQKLQRFLKEDISEKDYLQYLSKHADSSSNGGLAFYGSDAEIIDYHPGHLDAKYQPTKNNPDLKRLLSILGRLQSNPKFSWTTPNKFSQTLDNLTPPIRLESAEYPLPCKKQPKYNPTRWAVSGRDDSLLNTNCYRLFYDITALESQQPVSDSLWRKLLENWGSDFRTHTTDEKTELLRHTTAVLKEELTQAFSTQQNNFNNNPLAMAFWNPNTDSYPDFLSLEVQFPPQVLQGYPVLQEHPNLLASQIEEIETYQDGSIRCLKAILQVNLPSQTETIFTWKCGEVGRPSKINCHQTPFNTLLQTEAVTLKIIPKRGGAIESLQFNQLDNQPWVGTIPHGWFDDIALSADFYSGHFILASKSGEKATDLLPGEVHLPDNTTAYPIRVPIRIGIQTPIGKLWKTLYVYQQVPRLDLLYHFRFQDVTASSCRVGMMTVLPNAFDQETLAYTTVNGGLKPERFSLKGHKVTHDEPVSIAVSAQHGLGATEGWVAIEDKTKRIILKTYPGSAYAMPMIHYEETHPGYFLRVLPSIGEFDDTSHTLRRGHHQVMFTWEGQHISDPIQALHPLVSLSSHVTVLAI